MKYLVLFIGFVALVGCASASKAPHEINQKALLERGITARTKAPHYEYEKFYKTSGLSHFKFSADQKTLYFLKSDGKVKNVFRYDIKTKKTTQMTKYQEPVSEFIPGYKGKYLYIQKDRGGSEVYDLYRFNLKNKKTRALTRGKNKERSYLCDLTKDGNKLYYSQSRNTRAVYDIKELDLSNLKSRTIKKAGNEQLYCNTVSKNGSFLAFRRFINNNEIHMGYIDLNTEKAKYVVSDKGVKNFNDVIYGNALYFLSTKGSDKTRIWKYDLASGELSLRDTAIDQSVQSFGVYGDGKYSVISYRGELKAELAVFSGIFQDKVQFKAPIASDLTSFGAHEENPSLALAIVENSYTPAKYYIKNGENVDLIYDSNQSGIPNDHFAKSISTFVESFDGLDVPVHFFIPNGTSELNKRPAIFWIHGGPEDHVDPTYSPRIQYLVNRGYIVVAPNVRGSTGFGKAYQFKDNGDWGGGHIKDIVEVANYTKGLNFVDKENVFILGGSFGGFSVMSTITQYPSVFKAAINIFGLVEMASFMESWPPIAQKYWISEMGKDPREDDEFNRKLSPLYHVEKVKVPVQIHQGANDIRVVKNQSDMLVDRMKKKGLSVDYKVYKDEGHGFLKFANSKRCFESIEEFVRTHTN